MKIHVNMHLGNLNGDIADIIYTHVACGGVGRVRVDGGKVSVGGMGRGQGDC